MIRVGLALATTLAVLRYGPFPLTQHDDTNGRWRGELQDGRCNGNENPDGLCLALTLEPKAEAKRSETVLTIAASAVAGIDIKSDRFSKDNVHFEVRREAGTVSFAGSFASGIGRGEFVFLSNRAYSAGLEHVGFASLSQADLLALALENVTQRFAGEVAHRGYAKNGVGNLIAFQAHGVTPEFIDQVVALGYEHPAADDLVSLRVHDVSLRFLKETRERHGQSVSLADVIDQRVDEMSPRERRLAARSEDADDDDDEDADDDCDRCDGDRHEISPRHLRGLDNLDLELDLGDLSNLRLHGISPGFVNGMVKAGLESVDIGGIVSASVQGVTPDFVRDMVRAGLESVDLDDLISAHVQGITPEYVRSMRAAGLEDLDLDDLTNARVQGVTPEFVRDMIGAGLRHLDLSELTALRIHGVDRGFAKRYLDRHPHADPDELIEARER